MEGHHFHFDEKALWLIKPEGNRAICAKVSRAFSLTVRKQLER